MSEPTPLLDRKGIEDAFRRLGDREKLITIRDELAGIRRDIERLTAELDAGRAVFELALDLLDSPQELYRQAGPALRRTMNQTIFTKLRVDVGGVTSDELAEPFDVIVPAGRAYALGSNKDLMVGRTGFQPVTSSVSEKGEMARKNATHNVGRLADSDSEVLPEQAQARQSSCCEAVSRSLPRGP